MNTVLEFLRNLSPVVQAILAVPIVLLYLGSLLLFFSSMWMPVQRLLMGPTVRTFLLIPFLLQFRFFRRDLLRPYVIRSRRKCEGRPDTAHRIVADIQLKLLDPTRLSHELRRHRLAFIHGAVGRGETSYLATFFCKRPVLLGPHVPLLLRPRTEEEPIDTMRTELATAASVTDTALADLLLEKGPLLILVDGLDDLPPSDFERWVDFGKTWSHANLFCISLARPPRDLKSHLISVPLVEAERVREMIRAEVQNEHPWILDSGPEVIDLLGSPLLLSKVLQQLRSSEGRFGSRVELLEHLLRSATEAWTGEDSPELLLSGVCEAAFRSVLFGTLSFESKSLPERAIEDLIAAGFLARRGGRVEYGHSLFRSFLAAKHFVPRWQRLIGIEGRDLDPASAAGMVDLAIELVPSEQVEALAEAVGAQNSLLAKAVLERLEPGPSWAGKALSVLAKSPLDGCATHWPVESGPIYQGPWSRWLSERKPDASLLEEFPRRGPGFPAIRVRRLRLQNIKCFDRLDFDFRVGKSDVNEANTENADESSVRGMTVMVGENSTGKSTILQTIALGCLGAAMANQTEGFRARTILRRGASEGSIELELDFIVDRESSNGEHVIHVGLGLSAQEEDFYPLADREMTLGTRNHAQHMDVLRRRVGFEWGLCVGYGPFRALKDPEKGTSQPASLKPAAERVLSLFVRATTLMLPEALERLLYEGDATMFSSEAPCLPQERREEIVRRISEAIPGLESKAEDDELRLVESFREVSDLSQLSDGPNSMIALLAHLIRHALQITGWKTSPFDVMGVVLLDEADLHLHPTWQREVLPHLAKMFPMMQIIATTHAPLVVGGVPDGQVHVLRQQRDGKVELLSDLPSVKGWEADQILTSQHFGVSTTYDIETEKLLSEYVELIGKPGDHTARICELDRLLRQRRPRDVQVTELDSAIWDLFLDFAKNHMAGLPKEKRRAFAETMLNTLGSRETS